MRKRRVLPNWLDTVAGTPVLLTATDGRTYRGLMLDQYEDGVCLLAAALLQADGTPVPINGELFVPRARVAVIQRPPTNQPEGVQ